MTITLCAHRLSQLSRAVEILLRELSITYNWQEVDFASGHTHELDYAERINAFETIPALHVASYNTAAGSSAPTLKIGESDAALRYLCRSAPHRDRANVWYPGDSDISRSADIDQWLSWHHGNVRRYDMFHHIMNLHQTLPMLKREIQATLLEPLQQALNSSLALMDSSLAAHDRPVDQPPTLTHASSPTLADLVIGCELYQIVAVGYRLERYPSVQHWLDGLAARPCFSAVSQEINELGATIGEKNRSYLALDHAFS